jgi:anthranilate synthase/aminodeoxychorismate synthase-like glutamine amidotransferase
MHGKASMINHDQRGVFADIDQPLKATRYHSLIVGREQFPYETLDVTAWSDKGEIMGLQHKQWPVYGVQFHPESILTSNGYRLLEHFFAEAYHESMA